MELSSKKMSWEERRERKNREIAEAIANVQDEATQIDIIMKKRGCFGPSEDNEFYAVVQDYLNNNINAKDATKKLLDPINKAILQNRKHLPFLSIWYSIIHSAKRLSFRDTHGLNKLVTLMKTIKASFPPPTAKDSDMYTCLRRFGMAARESIDDGPGGQCGYMTQEVHAYANMLYFYALITRENVRNFWIYCIWQMRNALETPHEDDANGTAIQKYNSFIPSAAVWIFAMGKQVYEREQDLTPKKATEGDPGRGGPLWKGRAEFSKQRWALWKKSFGELAGMEGLTEEARAIAKEAAQKMDWIDREAKEDCRGPRNGACLDI
ncbi:hypothetical protein J4E83_002869 [Alternaria metachromatica]|uniref:uncharacterized protein n=1 Tax=Alternaria metachromatica TaxID=283354 RepID=UPI0020C3FB41|nr:uncharacterized protein J4E83_002869 [Alternaria metachromatica]KAI4631338.1 hypothetical protein J4E83_002869 [Alternaria metachromatica]